VKRLLIIICTIFLLLDLADDGYLGKAPFGPLSSSQQFSSYSEDYNSGKAEFPEILQLEDFWEAPRISPIHTVTPVFQSILKIINCCHLNSSGGIPL
jgi:hypothetical protein